MVSHMADSFSTCLAFTLQQEGGWADNPHDNGGCTMEGITLATYRDVSQNPDLTPDDLRAISSAEVSTIYQLHFWNIIHGLNLPLGVDLMVFDQAVNAGVSRSVKILQKHIGETADGFLGPATLTAVLALDPTELVNGLADAQSAFYRSLSNFKTFGKDWLRRVNERQTAALNMMSTS